MGLCESVYHVLPRMTVMYNRAGEKNRIQAMLNPVHSTRRDGPMS